MSSKDGSIVSKSISRRVSAQEATIQQQDEPNQSQFECPICIYWLNEPVVTTCGHRFCKKCITAWLKKPNPCCPIDNHPLAEADLFPDNYTRREIQQIRRSCRNNGCEVVVSPLEMDAHLAQCEFGSTAAATAGAAGADAGAMVECSFKRCGCIFVAEDAAQMETHLSGEMVMHLNLLMATYNNSINPYAGNGRPATASDDCISDAAAAAAVEQHHAWDAPTKLANGLPLTNGVNGEHHPEQPNEHAEGCQAVALATTSQAAAAAAAFASGPAHYQRQLESTAMMKALYERIVILEQQSREKDSQLDRLAQQIARLSIGGAMANSLQPSASAVGADSSAINPRYSGGVLVWRIAQFQAKVASMSADPNAMFYSGESYTTPHGYRYCVRINISPKFREFIGLHVHLMQSDNDYHLEWPFRGRIKISMIHRNQAETKNDIIMSKPEIQAFHRPTQEVSPRGFGFLEYASISHVLTRGFVVADVLTIKVQLSIV